MAKVQYQHRNQVRIIGGTHRGRKLTFPAAEGLRPTADSVRERLFNWLGQDLTGMAVLDLFAGSGVMGLEAASRNAAKVTMIEKNRQVAAAIKSNVQQLNFGQIELICTEAHSFLINNHQQFNIVFLDPPYVWQQWHELLEVVSLHLLPNARVYMECNTLPVLPAGWEVLKQGKSGISRFELLTYHKINTE
ncbi:16S rRNA (guanine(966)-N(2))-methyltransferase RsmD [Snodgrassella sp. ESL0304]|uniref:16S rRNA (guanine(966)-N(2))-methyltransferase RsmD n=1 Tax=Snodgrassella TaxID=1193515 RepID=UPI001583BDB5|nr:16S rRNA (guanine(966)-N(2))-methyltransferase RsmD [Snodgrassella sp. ESL0304]